MRIDVLPAEFGRAHRLAQVQTGVGRHHVRAAHKQRHAQGTDGRHPDLAGAAGRLDSFGEQIGNGLDVLVHVAPQYDGRGLQNAAGGVLLGRDGDAGTETGDAGR